MVFAVLVYSRCYTPLMLQLLATSTLPDEQQYSFWLQWFCHVFSALAAEYKLWRALMHVMPARQTCQVCVRQTTCSMTPDSEGKRCTDMLLCSTAGVHHACARYD